MISYRPKIVTILIPVILIAIFFANQYFTKKRNDSVIQLVQRMQEGISYRYGVPGDSSIQSASGSVTLELPQNPLTLEALGDFHSFVQNVWNYMNQTREQDMALPLEDQSAIRKTGEEQVYELKQNDLSIHLNFRGDRQLHEVSIESKEKKNSVSITYYEAGTPDRVLFGDWLYQPVGASMKFFPNGQLQEYAFLWNGYFLGPVLLWDENGQLKQNDFYERPHPASDENRSSN